MVKFDQFKELFTRVVDYTRQNERAPVLFRDPINSELIESLIQQKTLEVLYNNEKVLRYYSAKYKSFDTGKFFMDIIDDLYKHLLAYTTYTEAVQLSGHRMQPHKLVSASLQEITHIQYNLLRLYLSFYTVLHKYLYTATEDVLLDKLIETLQNFDADTLERLMYLYNLGFVVLTQVNASVTIAYQNLNLLQKIKFLELWINTAKKNKTKSKNYPATYVYKLNLGKIKIDNGKETNLVFIPKLYKLLPIDATLIRLLNYGVPALIEGSIENAKKNIAPYIKLLYNLDPSRYSVHGKTMDKEHIRSQIKNLVSELYIIYLQARALLKSADNLEYNLQAAIK